MLVLPQPKRQRDQQAAFEDREPADHPDHRKRAQSGPRQQENAEGNRHQTTQNQDSDNSNDDNRNNYRNTVLKGN